MNIHYVLGELTSPKSKESNGQLIASPDSFQLVQCQTPNCQILRVYGCRKSGQHTVCIFCLAKEYHMEVKDRHGHVYDALICPEGQSIGKGSFGHIDIVLVKIHGMPVERLAMKFTNPKDGVLSVTESNLMLKLKQENIVQLIYFHEGTKSITFLMELMEDGDLYHFIHSEWRADEGIGVYCELFAYQIFRALAHMHSRDIMHRDIKPQNIVISLSTGMAKLIDFNVSCTFKPPKYRSPKVGTKPYNAPELLLYTKDYNEKVDIWSAAVTVTAMIVSKPVFFRGIKTKVKEPLIHIMEFLGCPTEQDFDAMAIPEKEQQACPQVEKCKDLNRALQGAPGVHDKKQLMNLLNNVFIYNYHKRLSASAVLQHPFFDYVKNSPDCLWNGNPLPDIFGTSGSWD